MRFPPTYTYQIMDDRVIEGVPSTPVGHLLRVAHSFEQFARRQGLPDTVPPFAYTFSRDSEGARVWIDLHGGHPAWDDTAFNRHAFQAWAITYCVDLLD